MWKQDQASELEIEIRALRDIEEGEKLTINYLTQTENNGKKKNALTVEDRRTALNNHWDFVCTCPKCLGEAGESEPNLKRQKV